MDFSGIERRVAMMWECFPHLHLPHKYGTDLLVIEGAELQIPAEDALDEVYEWPWRKVQQYYVKLVTRDPGEKDNSGTRAALVGHIRGRLTDRAQLSRYLVGGLRVTHNAPKPTSITRVKRRKKS